MGVPGATRVNSAFSSRESMRQSSLLVFMRRDSRRPRLVVAISQGMARVSPMATATSPARRGPWAPGMAPTGAAMNSRLHLGRALGLVSRGCDRRQEGRRLADDETPGRDIVSRRGAPGGPRGPGLRRPPERGATDTAAAHPHARSPGAPPDRLRERPRALALSPALLAPGRLRRGPSRRRRVRGAAAGPVRVLGPRGVASARGASPAPALAHGAGRAGPRPLSEPGASSVAVAAPTSTRSSPRWPSAAP